MAFYIYENWRANDKTVIHKADCRYCNQGKGIGIGTRGTENGKWYGEFKSFDEAQTFALTLHRNKNTFCSFCKPDKV